MASNISISELMGALEKSGLPLGDGTSMQQAAPFGRDAVASQVYGADTQLPQLSQNYRSQLDAIAQMDQKLAGVYGDPSSKLFIEHAGKRENAIFSPRGVANKETNRISTSISNRKKELDSEVDDALSLYNKLVTVQLREEDRVVKEAKDAERVKAGKGKYINVNGKKVVTPVYKGKAGAGSVKLTKEQKLAGFQDSDAANYWSKIKETDFKREWAQNVLDGSWEVPDDGFDIASIKRTYDHWKTIAGGDIY